MNLALFDFDGTITTSDAFTAFVFGTVAPRRMAAGRIALAPLVAAYRLGVLPATALRQAIVAFGYRGRRGDELRRAGEAYAADTIPRLVRPEAQARLDWHRAQGDTIVVVSASLSFYLDPWCRAHGFDLLCVRLRERAGRLTGRYAGGDCTAGEKARRVRERYELAKFPVIYAYGDTAEDRELLGLAHRRFYQGAEIDPSTNAMTMAKTIR